VEVQNIGDYDGEEVVQLYINDVYSSVTTPLKTLKGFERIKIKKGEKTTVVFTLTPEELTLWNAEMEELVESGEFEVMVGGNSRDLLRSQFTIVPRQENKMK
jgi:beta-glucosidase